MDKTYLKKIGLIPTYDELELFLMSMAYFFIILANPHDIRDIFFLDDIRGYIMMIIFNIGAMLSVVFIFIPGKTPPQARNLIIFFAVYINAMIGFRAGLYLMESYSGTYMMIFPVFNILSAFYLFMLFRAELIDADNYIEKEVNIFEIGVSVLLLWTIFLICEVVYDFYWAITYSICLFYALMFTEVVSKAYQIVRT